MSRNSTLGIIVLLLLIGAAVFLMREGEPAPAREEPVAELPVREVRHEIGRSVNGRIIESFTYGSGDKALLFVGGVHGGYEWNSTLLAYMFIDYLEANEGAVPAGYRIVIVPTANPDGLFDVIGKEGRFTSADVREGDHASGRFNARGVDLNRNFDCKWEPQSMWRSKVVSAGSEAFSEPESRALRSLVEELAPEAVIFWHSQADAVYASECEDGVLAETKDIMHAYAKAAGYKAVESFDSYSVTGDSEGWLASIGIPAITVELSTHESPEWEKNIRGIEALFGYYARKAI